ncbi:MAG: hypothetical protein AAGA60_21725 [Cyanobacteria bacterium P01_E01_bin.42]
MSEEKSIWIVTADSSGDPAGGKGLSLKDASDRAIQSVQVSASTLKENMAEFIDLVGDIFASAETKTGMKLDEVEVAVEITGNGEVKLMGTGMGVEGKGAITLKFKREG